MATHLFNSFGFSDIMLTGSLSGTLQIDPDWNAGTSAYQFEITDDDGQFQGDASVDEVSDDATQSAIIRDETGTVVQAGDVYLETAYTVTDEYGNTVNIYLVEVNGTPAGYVADGPLQPGNLYTYTAADVGPGTAPDYANLTSQTYSPDAATVVEGTSNADQINAGAASDTVNAGAGGDTIDGGAGNDRLYGETGNDSIEGGAGADSLFGGDDNDTLLGGDGSDLINGQFGNDDIDGGAGADNLYGNAGNDTVRGGTGDDYMFGGTGDDLVEGGDDADTIYTEDAFGTDTLVGGEGGTDDDTLNFTPVTTAVSVTFADEEMGTVTDGTSTLTFSQIENLVLTDQDDSVDASATWDGAFGDNPGINVDARSGADTVTGGNGSDTIVGGAGNDSIDGDYGDDILVGDDGNDILLGGDGNDDITGGDGNDLIDAGSDGDTVQGGIGHDTIDGASGDDFIEGGDGHDSIDGGDQDDTIFGGEGDDVIEAGEENSQGDADYIDGGSGNDTITSVEEDDDSNDTIFGGSGLDVIAVAGGNNLLDGGADSDTITGGQHSDTIYGGTGVDLLSGGLGADLFVAEDGFGNDVITGGGGAPTPGQDVDTIDVGTVPDAVTVSLSGDQSGTITNGVDTITFNEIERLDLTEQADVVDASGDSSGMIIDGRDGNDTIEGGAGADTIYGRSGADSLLGGNGNDVLDGRSDDLLILMNFADGGSGVAVDASGLGNDGVYQGGATSGGTGWTGQPGDTALVLDGVDDYLEIPNTRAFELTEGTVSIRFNADTLHSGALVSRDSQNLDGGGHFRIELNSNGSISFRIQSADDSYLGTTSGGLITAGDWHQVSATFGSDGFKLYVDGVLKETDSYTGGLVGNSEPWVLGADQHVSGDGVANNLDEFFHGQIDEFALHSHALTAGEVLANYTNGIGPTAEAGDTMRGEDGDDSIIAGGGDDNLTGGLGRDTLEGGAGNDTIDGGLDDDTIYGGDGSDLIYGGAGNDLLLTGLGNDTLLGGDGNDTLMNSDGDDSLVGGAGDDSIVATGGNDTLKGEAGADTLDGGADNDSLYGGTGDDVLTGGDGDDTFFYSPGDGNDTITDFNFGNSGATGDDDTINNDFIDLSSYYDAMSELYADQADDGILNQSNTTDTKGQITDYSDNTQFGSGSLEFQGATADTSTFTADNTGVVCFTTGTAIRTPGGDVLVEDLRVGDLVVTADNGPQPIRWIGTRNLFHQDLLSAPNLRPVLISEGALGNTRPLLVSPQHCMLLGKEGMVRAKHLAETTKGVRIAHGKRLVTYIHLMFDAHEVIFAENAPSESFYPGPMSLRIIDSASRRALFEVFPQLNGTVSDHADCTRLFGDRVRQVIPKKAVRALGNQASFGGTSTFRMLDHGAKAVGKEALRHAVRVKGQPSTLKALIVSEKQLPPSAIR